MKARRDSIVAASRPVVEAVEQRFMLADFSLLGTRLIREADYPSTSSTGGVLQFYLRNDAATARTINSFELNDKIITGSGSGSLINVPVGDGSKVNDTRWWQAWPKTVQPGKTTTVRVRLPNVTGDIGATGDPGNSADDDKLELFITDPSNNPITDTFTFETPGQTDLWLPHVAFDPSNVRKLTIYAANRGTGTIGLANNKVTINGTLLTSGVTVTGTSLAAGQIAAIDVLLGYDLNEGDHITIKVEPASGGNGAAYGSMRVLDSTFAATTWSQFAEADQTDLGKHLINTTMNANVFQDEPIGAKKSPQTVANNVITTWNSTPTRVLMGQNSSPEEIRIYTDLYDAGMTHHGPDEQDLSLFMAWPKPIWYLPQDAWGRSEGVGGRESWYRLQSLQHEAYRGIAHGAKHIQWFTYANLYDKGIAPDGVFTNLGQASDYGRTYQDFYMAGAIGNPALWDRVGRINGVLKTVEDFLIESSPVPGFRQLQQSNTLEVNTIVHKTNTRALVVLSEYGNDGFYSQSSPTSTQAQFTNISVTAKIPTWFNSSADKAYLVDPVNGVTQITSATINPGAGTATLPGLTFTTGAMIVICSATEGSALATKWSNLASTNFGGYSDQLTSTATPASTDIRGAKWSHTTGGGQVYGVESNADGSRALVAQGNSVYILKDDGTILGTQKFTGRVFYARWGATSGTFFVGYDNAAASGVYYTDTKISKYNLSDLVNPIWTTALKGVSDTQPLGILDMEPTTDGGIIYARANRKIAKLASSNGAEVWTYTYGAAGESPSQLVTTPDGGAVVYGGQYVTRLTSSGTVDTNYSGLRENPAPFNVVAVSPLGNQVAWAGNSLNMFTSGAGAKVMTYIDRQIRVIKYSPNGTKIAVGTSDGSFAIVNASTGAVIWKNNTNKSTIVSDIQFRSDNEVAVMYEYFGYSTGTHWKFRDYVVAYDVNSTAGSQGTANWRTEGAWRDQPFMGQLSFSSTNNRLYIATNRDVRFIDLSANAVNNQYLYDTNRPAPIPSGWTLADVGSPAEKGTGRFSTLDGSLIQQGGGADIKDGHDEFSYLYKPVTGSATVIVKVARATSPDSYSEAGIMFRTSTDHDAAHASLLFVPRFGLDESWRNTNTVRHKYRASDHATYSAADWGSGSDNLKSVWLKIIRTHVGTTSTFTYAWSADNTTWNTLAATDQILNAPTTMLVGTAVSSHSVVLPDVPGVGIMEATFSDLSVGSTVSMPLNLAPTVNAGADKNAGLSQAMTGSGSDDSFPTSPGSVTYTWTKISGPGTVTFTNPNSLTSSATFSTAGTYVLRLTGVDGLLATADEVTVVANAATTDPAPYAWWKLNETGTNTAVDSSSHAYTSTWTGTPAWSTSGKHAGALNLSGSNYLNLSSDLNFESAGYGQPAFSVTAWINTNQLTSRQTIYSNTGGMSLETQSGKIQMRIRSNTPSTNWYMLSGGTLTSGWHHVAMVYQANAPVKLYLDGALVATSADNYFYDHSGASDDFIGHHTDGYNFTGLIDDVRVYSTALDATQVVKVQDNAMSNVLANGGMTSASGSPLYPTNWGNARPNSGQDTDHHDGDGFSLKAGAGNTYAYQDLTTPLKSNTYYTLRAWVKVNKVSAGSISTRVRYVENGAEKATTSTLTASSGWQELTVTFLTGSSVTSGRVDLMWNLGTGDNVWFDDVRLTET